MKCLNIQGFEYPIHESVFEYSENSWIKTINALILMTIKKRQSITNETRLTQITKSMNNN